MRAEFGIDGMDCHDCARHVQAAICKLPGVQRADVLLGAEKAIVEADTEIDREAVAAAVRGAGYRIRNLDGRGPRDGRDARQGERRRAARGGTAQAGAEHREETGAEREPSREDPAEFTRRVLTVVGLVFGIVLFVVVVGEWLGVIDRITDEMPWPLGLALVVAGGFPVFRNVLRAAVRGRVISHTLMTVGTIAAIAVGEWATALVVVFFMRMGEYAESFTTEKSRRAVRDLTALAPARARVLRDGEEQDLPIDEVASGDTVVVRPGEMIPVDGVVSAGRATVDQAAITGESMPVERGAGEKVYAASYATLGSLRITAEQVGESTVFGNVVRLVEEAEAKRGRVARIADRFSAYYLPVVLVIAAAVVLVRGDVLAAAAVLVVACSCSFALATPIAILASIGASAKRGILIKGGSYLERLASVDVVLLDKTGTLTLGEPRVEQVLGFNGVDSHAVLELAAGAERYSEHPLAEAVRRHAASLGVTAAEPAEFSALPGRGVQAVIGSDEILVGNRAAVLGAEPLTPETMSAFAELERVRELEDQGRTVVYVARNGTAVGAVAFSDSVRPEVPDALDGLRALGLHEIELLTGDNAAVAGRLAEDLGLRYRAELLPEDKITAVRDYQAAGKRVLMVGDGVNDAPALAQADVGLAMGAAGSEIALQAGHMVLLRDDWAMVPEVVGIARRTMRVIVGNIGFTTVYNIAGLSLAALGFLPPIFAAALQSLPDLGILANSSRLLRTRAGRPETRG